MCFVSLCWAWPTIFQKRRPFSERSMKRLCVCFLVLACGIFVRLFVCSRLWFQQWLGTPIVYNLLWRRRHHQDKKKLKTKMHRWKTHCCNLGVIVPTKADLLSASSFIPNVSSWTRSGSLPSRMQAGANKLAPSFKVGPHREPPK